MIVVGVALAPLVAHQGGWDEVLLFATPIAGAILLIRWLEARARRKTDEDRPIE